MVKILEIRVKLDLATLRRAYPGPPLAFAELPSPGSTATHDGQPPLSRPCTGACWKLARQPPFLSLADLRCSPLAHLLAVSLFLQRREHRCRTGLSFLPCAERTRLREALPPHALAAAGLLSLMRTDDGRSASPLIPSTMAYKGRGLRILASSFFFFFFFFFLNVKCVCVFLIFGREGREFPEREGKYVCF